PRAEADGLGLPPGQAQRLRRPASRRLVLAEPPSLAAIPGSRWPALAPHPEGVVVLLTPPLARARPWALLPSAGAGRAGGDAVPGRLELDLAAPAARARWQAAFGGALADTSARLAARGVRVVALSCDAPSDAWLGVPRHGSH